MDLALLIIAGFLTSAVTATLGLGGGVLLILVMPGLLPLNAVLPVHAVVQTTSNVARAAFAWREIAWHMLPPLLMGSLVGGIAGGEVVGMLSLDLLPAISGALILLVTWVPRILPLSDGRYALALLGFYQTGLGMLAGATGPLGAAVLARLGQQRDWVVVNTGVYMAINHAVRSVVYATLGSAFASWWPTILSMSLATIFGALLGSRLRRWIPERNFTQIFRWLITLLALRMIALSLSDISL